MTVRQVEGGELGLGRNLVIAYTNFGGYGFEDAILISDRLVKEDLLTSIHIEEYEAEVVDTKLGPEEINQRYSQCCRSRTWQIWPKTELL